VIKRHTKIKSQCFSKWLKEKQVDNTYCSFHTVESSENAPLSIFQSKTTKQKTSNAQKASFVEPEKKHKKIK